MSDDPNKTKEPGTGLSRRDFIKLGTVTVAAPIVLGPTMVEAAGEEVAVFGPGKAPITLTVNGKPMKAEVEPRITLLDLLREQFDMTGTKRVCDRGECGACTVLLDGKPVYACQILAIDAQGHKITTIEGLSADGKLTPVQQAFVDNDAQQCGFCTPGFVVATTAFLAQHPHPTDDDIRHGLSGNFCRCGTYAGIRAAVAQAAGKKGGA